MTIHLWLLLKRFIFDGGLVYYLISKTMAVKLSLNITSIAHMTTPESHRLNIYKCIMFTNMAVFRKNAVCQVIYHGPQSL